MHGKNLIVTCSDCYFHKQEVIVFMISNSNYENKTRTENYIHCFLPLNSWQILFSIFVWIFTIHTRKQTQGEEIIRKLETHLREIVWIWTEWSSLVTDLNRSYSQLDLNKSCHFYFVAQKRITKLIRWSLYVFCMQFNCYRIAAQTLKKIKTMLFNSTDTYVVKISSCKWTRHDHFYIQLGTAHLQIINNLLIYQAVVLQSKEVLKPFIFHMVCCVTHLRKFTWIWIVFSLNRFYGKVKKKENELRS